MNGARWDSEIPKCKSRWGAYECAQSEGHGGYHETEGGFTRWNDGAPTGPVQKRTPADTAVPTPEAMSLEAFPYLPGGLSHVEVKRRQGERAAYIAGVEAERARVAAWLRANHCPMRADEIEGKVST